MMGHTFHIFRKQSEIHQSHKKMYLKWSIYEVLISQQHKRMNWKCKQMWALLHGGGNSKL